MLGLQLDLTQRVVNVHWGDEAPQQGLLAEYPPGPGAPEFESIQEVMQGTPTAYALDSGQTFSGVNMGASGLGHTVLTAGLICFGMPRDGDACFIACPGFKYSGSDADNGLQRGTLNALGRLIWVTTGGSASGRLTALSFTGDAFFAVYFDFLENKTTIATSFDGENWSTALFEEKTGAVASVITERRPNGTIIRTYVSVGDIGQSDDDYYNTTSLLQATSTDGQGWATGFNPGILSNPGTRYVLTNNYACTVAAKQDENSTGIFVAAAATKTPVDPGAGRFLINQTAAAAVSSSGSDWDSIAVGLAAGLDQESFGLAVTFVKTKDDGYFLMSDHEQFVGDNASSPAFSNLYKSVDGLGWTKMRSNINWMATLSAVASDLNRTKIVFI